MPLIDSSYFIGERNIPNTNYPDVASLLDNLIAIREKEYLTKALGYELFKLFQAGLQQVTQDARYIDILVGADFVGWDGYQKRWGGLIAVTDPSLSLSVTPTIVNDIFFTVGVDGPADSAASYVNVDLAGKSYRVTQRGFGPLEQLKSDNSNIATADIQTHPEGGFSWLGNTNFEFGDKYLITPLSSPLDLSTAPIATQPESPIADYVYYWYLRGSVNSPAGTGQVQADNQNSTTVSSVRQAAKSYNDMVEKTCLLSEFLQVNSTVYPEFQNYAGSRDLWYFLRRVNIFNI